MIDTATMTVSELRDLLDQIHKQLDAFGLKARNGHAGAPLKLDYESLDWTKKNKELAEEHGVSYVTIATWRRKLNKPKVCGGKHWPVCQTWDWTKSDTQIARENKVELNSVKKWRKRLGKPFSPRDFQSPDFPEVHGLTQYDWSIIDWNFPDIQIARKHGMTRERVRQKRAYLGFPKMLNWNWKYEQFLKEFKDSKELTFNEAKEKFPELSHSTFYKYCTKAGIPFVQSKKPCQHPWHLMDWRLPNKLLREIWLCPRSLDNYRMNVVGSQRCNHTMHKAAFKSIKGSIPEEWIPVVEEEKRKAAEWFKGKV